MHSSGSYAHDPIEIPGSLEEALISTPDKRVHLLSRILYEYGEAYIAHPAFSPLAGYQCTHVLELSNYNYQFEAIQLSTNRPVTIRYDISNDHHYIPVEASCEQAIADLIGLSHPGIVSIYAHELTADGVRWSAVQRAPGKSLAAKLSGIEPLPGLKGAVAVGAALCDTLSFIHELPSGPVLHHNIIPGYIYFDGPDHVVLGGFEDMATTFTPGTKYIMRGTEGYSAPEQYRGDICIQTDIYAVAANLHHWITGQDPMMAPPFTFQERPLASYNPEIPVELDQILLKALAFNTKDRFQTAAEFKAAMQSVLPKDLH